VCPVGYLKAFNFSVLNFRELLLIHSIGSSLRGFIPSAFGTFNIPSFFGLKDSILPTKPHWKEFVDKNSFEEGEVLNFKFVNKYESNVMRVILR
jgi:hypothetical protein